MDGLVDIIRECGHEIAKGNFLGGWNRIAGLSPDYLPEGTGEEKTELGIALVREFPESYTTAPVGCVAYLIGLEVSAHAGGELQDLSRDYFLHYFASYGLKMMAEGRIVQDSELVRTLEQERFSAENRMERYWSKSPLLSEFAILVWKANDKWGKLKIEGQQASEQLIEEINIALRSGQRSKAQEAARKHEELKAQAPQQIRAGSIFADAYFLFVTKGGVSQNTVSLSTDGLERGNYLGFFELLNDKTGYHVLDLKKRALAREMPQPA